jgi:hypothetical protein
MDASAGENDMIVEAKRSPAQYRLRRLIGNIGFGFSVLVLISPAILFFLWMLSLSFKNELDNTDWPPVFIPQSPTLDNYREVFARNDFLRFAWNSVVVSFGATGIALLIGVPAGYGIAKMRGSADPDCAHHARAFLSDSAVFAVPMARHDRHADAHCHHAFGDHGADCGLGDDFLL